MAMTERKWGREARAEEEGSGGSGGDDREEEGRGGEGRVTGLRRRAVNDDRRHGRNEQFSLLENKKRYARINGKGGANQGKKRIFFGKFVQIK